MLTEAEAVEHARSLTAHLTWGSPKEVVTTAHESLRRFWIDWTENRHRSEPKVDKVTGEVLPPKEYRCIDCDAELVRPDGHRGRMFVRCPECREKVEENIPGPVLHFCESCETQLFREDGSPSGKGRWSKLCLPCKGVSPDQS